jgi:hypothetical protein
MQSATLCRSDGAGAGAGALLGPHPTHSAAKAFGESPHLASFQASRAAISANREPSQASSPRWAPGGCWLLRLHTANRSPRGATEPFCITSSRPPLSPSSQKCPSLLLQSPPISILPKVLACFDLLCALVVPRYRPSVPSLRCLLSAERPRSLRLMHPAPLLTLRARLRHPF